MSTLEDRMRDRARRANQAASVGTYKRAKRGRIGVGGSMRSGVRRTPRTVARSKSNTFSQLRSYLQEYQRRLK